MNVADAAGASEATDAGLGPLTSAGVAVPLKPSGEEGATPASAVAPLFVTVILTVTVSVENTLGSTVNEVIWRAGGSYVMDSRGLSARAGLKL
ncbi:MAG: hypothetical protein HYU51_16340 [Candidatus Rokubacteria bacterium]|nr:hypothetical protein [Candidatus Rokubacteria bacterium]